MTLTSISPETLVTSFSSIKEYVPLSGRTLGVTMSSVKVDFVTMDTRSPAVSSFSPKVHFAVGTGYPVIGTRIARGLGTITSRTSLNALRSRVGATVSREAHRVKQFVKIQIYQRLCRVQWPGNHLQWGSSANTGPTIFEGSDWPAAFSASTL